MENTECLDKINVQRTVSFSFEKLLTLDNCILNFAKVALCPRTAASMKFIWSGIGIASELRASELWDWELVVPGAQSHSALLQIKSHTRGGIDVAP